MWTKIQESWKALTAGVIALASMIVGFNADENIDLNEWGKVAAAAGALVVGLVAVWFVRNKPPAPEVPPETPDG